MTDGDDAEFSSPSEEDLHSKLDVVRNGPRAPVGHLTTSVVRTLRWQALIVLPVTGALAIASGLAGGFRVLVGSRKKDRS